MSVFEPGVKVIELGQPNPGVQIAQAAQEAGEICLREGCLVRFEFNGTPVGVEPRELVGLILEQWNANRLGLSRAPA